MKIYFDADAQPSVDDLAPQPATVVSETRPRRGLISWLLCMAVIMAGGTLILYGWEGSVYLNPATAAAGLAIWLATILVMLALRVIGRL